MPVAPLMHPPVWQAQAVLDALGQAVVGVDLAGRVAFWNREAERLFEWSGAEVIGAPVREMLGFEPADSVAVWQEVMAGRSWTGEHRLRSKSGRRFSVIVRHSPVFDGEGTVVGLVGVSVGAMVGPGQTSAWVRERERLADLVEDAPVLLFSVDATGAVRELQGVSTAPPRDQLRSAGVGRAIGWALAGEDIDVVVETEGRFLDVRLRPRRDAGGQVVEVVGVCSDVTEHRKAQQLVEASEKRLESLVQHAFDVAVVGDSRALLTWVSPAAKTMFGYEPEDMIGVSGLALVHPDDVAGVAAVVRDLLGRPGHSETVEFRLRHADGSWRWVEEVITNLLEDSTVAGLVGNLRDITERKEAALALAESEARFRGHFERAAVGQAMCDLRGRFVEVNESFCRITGFTADELMAMKVADLADPEDMRRAQKLSRELLRRTIASFDMEMRYRRKNGDTVYVWLSASLLYGRDGRPQFIPSVVQDVTERRRAEDELAHLALHDGLTALPNRTLLLDRLERIGTLRHDSTRSTAALLIDLDEFKLVNDTYGHDAGDALLRQVAFRLGDAVGATHTVARLGGDEFVVLCDDLDDPGRAVEIAERVRTALIPPFVLDSDEVFVSASIGIAATPGSRVDELLRDADVAMYRAKERGRSRYEIFDERLRTAAVARLRVQNDLHGAIERGDLRLLYQPVWGLDTGIPVGAEALVRWQHPVRGLLGPDQFIDIAERSGLIVPLGSWVLQEACATAASWGGSAVMAVNVSARQLGDPGLVHAVRSALVRSGLAPARLSLEITESALMEDPQAVLDTLIALKALGVNLAIDDFGTGYSSLLYLKRFPVDALKIDRTFVDGLGVDPEDSAIVSSVVSLARAVGIAAVAEGVETEVQLTELRRLGCTFGQGFLWARPEPADDVRRRLLAVTS